MKYNFVIILFCFCACTKTAPEVATVGQFYLDGLGGGKGGVQVLGRNPSNTVNLCRDAHAAILGQLSGFAKKTRLVGEAPAGVLLPTLGRVGV